MDEREGSGWALRGFERGNKGDEEWESRNIVFEINRSQILNYKNELEIAWGLFFAERKFEESLSSEGAFLEGFGMGDQDFNQMLKILKPFPSLCIN